MTLKKVFSSEDEVMSYASTQGWDMERYSGGNGICFTSHSQPGIVYVASRWANTQWHIEKIKQW